MVQDHKSRQKSHKTFHSCSPPLCLHKSGYAIVRYTDWQGFGQRPVNQSSGQTNYSLQNRCAVRKFYEFETNSYWKIKAYTTECTSQGSSDVTVDLKSSRGVHSTYFLVRMLVTASQNWPLNGVVSSRKFEPLMAYGSVNFNPK